MWFGVLPASLGILFLLWHECGEDLAIFCYRIGVGAFQKVRSLALVPVPVSQKFRRIPAARNYSDCSNRSVISSTRSMMSKD